MRRKRQRLQEIVYHANVLAADPASFHRFDTGWHTRYFTNQQAITLELGCGQGAYTVGLAQRFPDQNFVGVDIKGARLWKGSIEAQYLPNVAFLRIQIEQLMQFFGPAAVAAIYMPFPDPRPRNRDAKHRLTHARFLTLYRTILQPGGLVHLKTDHDLLIDYTRDVLCAQGITDVRYTADLYQSPWLAMHYGIQTAYEKRFLAQGKKIKYLCFSFEKS